ncbi:CidA/LrgA family protein [candidate division KSB3 bacterium]|uniref:CidA/LrgA family protein n=1 Tax=candidate division KSB3 bacterium TaxID=2044937 RepID=A0A9D5Q6L4_9BACT|nr:CidA/LrgA family protein [candidate division KSB3 bacterium]MBD3325979.1 CidA/LrgA family protein [candidate division KSB3 bacterium]
MIKSLAILFGCLIIGEFISIVTHLPVPGNVIGMLLLTLALATKRLRLEDVKPAADLLINHLALLFVPPGVGLLLYVDLLRQEWLPLVTAVVLSTGLVLAIVGHIQQRLESDHD